ncbi:MAG: hypothetical protein WKF87_19435 [Chryseolinea sp.]
MTLLSGMAHGQQNEIHLYDGPAPGSEHWTWQEGVNARQSDHFAKGECTPFEGMVEERYKEVKSFFSESPMSFQQPNSMR